MRAVCGLDVHKDTAFLCILCDTGKIIEKVFGFLTHQLCEMRRMMQYHGVSEVTMESTAGRREQVPLVFALCRPHNE